MRETAAADIDGLVTLAARIELAADTAAPAEQAAILSAFGPQLVAEAEAVAHGAATDVDVAGLVPQADPVQRIVPGGGGPGDAEPVQRQVAETLIMVGGGMIGTAEAAAPIEAGTGPPGWLAGAGLLLAGAALVGIGVYMASHGNVADTGILAEANALIAAGTAASMCAALEILMGAAKAAGDTRRQQRIKSTQKAKGCRHSRHS